MPNRPREGMTHLSVSSIPVELKKAVTKKAAERGESVSAVVRRALEEYVK